MTMALPPYSDRLLGYVDILGWSKIVRDETRAAEVPMAMLEVQAEKDTWEIANALVRADYAVQMSEFSDCVAFSCDVRSPEARSQLLSRVCRLYVLWLQRGFLCRGAILVGPLVHIDNVIFGPALVDAHDIEKRAAIYPRVVVREDDLKRLDYEPEKDAHEILRMEDDLPFLNPLLGWFPPGHASGNVAVQGMIRTEYGRWRTRLAEMKLAPNPDNDHVGVIAKYEWLLRYMKKAAQMTGLTLVD